MTIERAQAMILAAGRGQRMRPLTDNIPKPLLTVNDQPLIVYHLQALKRAGVSRVLINVSWLAEQIMQALGDGSDFGLHIEYSVEAEALETAGGIVNALDAIDEQFIVINADVFTDYPLHRLPAPQSEAHLVLVDNPPHNESGDFGIEQGMLSNRSTPRYTFSGIAHYRKSFFQGQQTQVKALAPIFREKADQCLITAEHYVGVWSDVGTPERLHALNLAANGSR